MSNSEKEEEREENTFSYFLNYLRRFRDDDDDVYLQHPFCVSSSSRNKDISLLKKTRMPYTGFAYLNLWNFQLYMEEWDIIFDMLNRSGGCPSVLNATNIDCHDDDTCKLYRRIIYLINSIITQDRASPMLMLSENNIPPDILCSLEDGLRGLEISLNEVSSKLKPVLSKIPLLKILCDSEEAVETVRELVKDACDGKNKIQQLIIEKGDFLPKHQGDELYDNQLMKLQMDFENYMQDKFCKDVYINNNDTVIHKLITLGEFGFKGREILTNKDGNFLNVNNVFIEDTAHLLRGHDDKNPAIQYLFFTRKAERVSFSNCVIENESIGNVFDVLCKLNTTQIALNNIKCGRLISMDYLFDLLAKIWSEPDPEAGMLKLDIINTFDETILEYENHGLYWGDLPMVIHDVSITIKDVKWSWYTWNIVLDIINRRFMKIKNLHIWTPHNMTINDYYAWRRMMSKILQNHPTLKEITRTVVIDIDINDVYSKLSQNWTRDQDILENILRKTGVFRTIADDQRQIYDAIIKLGSKQSLLSKRSHDGEPIQTHFFTITYNGL